LNGKGSALKLIEHRSQMWPPSSSAETESCPADLPGFLPGEEGSVVAHSVRVSPTTALLVINSLPAGTKLRAAGPLTAYRLPRDGLEA
jgi:hypothetical protein